MHATCIDLVLINLDIQKFMIQIECAVQQHNERRPSSFHAIDTKVIAFSVLKMLHERHFPFRLDLRHLLTAIRNNFLGHC